MTKIKEELEWKNVVFWIIICLICFFMGCFLGTLSHHSAIEVNSEVNNTYLNQLLE